jgi:putative Holliday junction resolvase
MKYLGIDYGSKRIGVAVSDESAVMAFPLGTVATGEGALQEVLDIIKENDVKVAVIGESRDFKLQKNPIMKEIEKFAEALQAHTVAVEFEPEFMTSAQAMHQFDPNDKLRTGKQAGKPRMSRGQSNKSEHNDASAAALILQSYLDRMRKSE